MEYFLLTIVGFVAGILSGLFGIGGGVIIVPALVFVCGFGLKQACGTSLMALLPPVGILGCIHYYRSGLVNLKAAFIIVAGMFFTVAYGAKLSSDFDVEFLKRCYGFFLLYVSWRFIKPFHLIKKAFGHFDIEILKFIDFNVHKVGEERNSVLLLALIGVAAGIASGLFGIGGGAVIVPALTTIMYYCPKRAAGTSLAVLLPPVGLLGVLEFHNSGNLEILKSIPVVAGIFVGTLFGAKFAVKLHPDMMRVMYGFFLLIIAIKYIFFA